MQTQLSSKIVESDYSLIGLDNSLTEHGETRASNNVGKPVEDTESIISAATLVTAAFRMRDEEGLIRSLRLLSNALGEPVASNDNEPTSTQA